MDIDKVPQNADEMRRRMENAGIDSILVEMNAEPDEVADLWEELCSSIQALTKEEEDDEGEALLPGECELCERSMPITRHHVHPKMVWDWAMKKLGKTKEECCSTIGVCRPCHNAIHRMADHKTLAEKYYTRELLLAAPAIQKFVAWAAKQKVRLRSDGGLGKYH
eukprot:Sspe_Gene.29965::Locus_14524_Transcript_1_1_Confidence_1.000_Length_847::g.29965::m.29965